MIIIRNLITIFTLLFLIAACNNITELKPEKVKIHYKTGELWCEGTYRVYKEGLSEKKNRIGVWNFYHLDGKISDQIEYDKFGNMINRKEYSTLGLLTVSQIVEDNVTTKTEYLPNGTTKYELIERVELETDDDAESEVYYYTYKEFFENGKIRELREYTGEDIQSLQIWDEKENIILEVEYEDGIIEAK